MIDLLHDIRRRPPRLATALRSCFLLLVTLAFMGPRLMAQALNPGGPVDFGTLPVNNGTNSLTLVFNASTTTNISAVTATTEGKSAADFQVPFQNCTGVQAPPSSCVITISFSPGALGLRRGALLIADSSGAIVNVVFLHGIGLAPQLLVAPAGTSALDYGISNLLPTSTATDGDGNVYVTDLNNNTIFRHTLAGANTALASLALTSNSSLAVSGQGRVYVSSPGSAKIYAMDPATYGVPTPVSTGSVTLVRPTGIAIDGLGYLYIADSAANTIVRVDLAGSGAATLTFSGLSTPLSDPTGLAVDASNNLYIADTGNNRIVKASLLTGKASVLGLGNLTLSSPQGVTADAAGSLTVADTGHARLVELPASGSPFVLLTPGSTLATPVGVFTQLNGDLLLSDSTAGHFLVSRSDPSLAFATPTKVGTTDAVDPDITATFQNSGNLPLQLTVPSSGSNPSVSNKAFAIDTVNSTCPVLTGGSSADAASQLALGAVCTYGLTFSPTNTGNNVAQLTLGAAPVGGGAALSQLATVSGEGYSTLASFSIVASPTPTTLGAPVTLVVTAFTNIGTVATDYAGTITFSTTDPTATFPAGLTYTFSSADAGTHTFSAPSGVRFNTVGTYTVTVADNTIAAVSNPVQVINPPTATLTSSSNQIYVGGSTTLSVTVSAPVGMPTGTVTFYNGSTPIGTATLTNGSATYTVPFSTPGTYNISSSYSGDSTFSTTTSNTVILNVQNATATVALSSSANPILSGGTSSFTVLVSSAYTTPTGTVTFLDAGTPLGTATLVNGSATLSASFTITGAHTITAAYSGDSTFPAAPSNPVIETVEDFSVAVAPGDTASLSANPGSPATFVLLISPVGANTLAAPVTYTVSGTPTAATVSFSPAAVPAGLGPSYINLVVTPAANRVARLDSRRRPGSRPLAPLAFGALLAPLAFLRRRSRLMFTLSLVLLTGIASLGLTGCLSDASSGYYAPTSHTYPLTITATSGPLTHSVIVSLTVE